MDSNSGKIFQKIRKHRHFKSTDFLPEISKATIYRFERGEVDISLSKFLFALHKMNISLREFESYATNFHHIQAEEDTTQLYFYFYHRDTTALKNLVATADDAIFRIAALSLYNELTTGKSLVIPLQEALVDFLFEVNDWGTYELTILNATISQLAPKRISLILESLREQTTYHNEVFHFSRRVSQIYLKGAFTFIRTDYQQKARKALDYAENFTKSDDLFSQNLIYFMLGAFDYKFGDKQKGLSEMREANHIFECLHSEHHADFLRFMVEKYLHIEKL